MIKLVKVLVISFALYSSSALSKDTQGGDGNGVTLSKRMYTYDPALKYPFQYIINDPLPTVDISNGKYNEKAKVADDAQLLKYSDFLRARQTRPVDQYRRAERYRRIKNYYSKKQEILTSELMAYDNRLKAIKQKKELFEAVAQQLQNLPPKNLAEHALAVAKATPNLIHFKKYFKNVETIHEKIREYLADKLYGPLQKSKKYSWVDDYLLILRDEASRLFNKDAAYFDLCHKYNKIETYDRKYVNGKCYRGKSKKELDADLINHKINKADLLLSVLLYGDVDSANELAAMRVTREPEFVAKRVKALKSLKKAMAKEKAWSREEGSH